MRYTSTSLELCAVRGRQARRTVTRDDMDESREHTTRAAGSGKTKGSNEHITWGMRWCRGQGPGGYYLAGQPARGYVLVHAWNHEAHTSTRRRQREGMRNRYDSAYSAYQGSAVAEAKGDELAVWGEAGQVSNGKQVKGNSSIQR